VTATRPPWTGQTGWHRAAWNALGWTETGVKLIAIAVAVTAAAAGGNWRVPASHAPPFWLITAVAIGYVGTVMDRWMDREIVAVLFVVLVLSGHWSLVYAMGGPTWPAAAVRWFTGCMAIGDAVKVLYFLRTGARVRNLPHSVPIMMSAALAVTYAVAFAVA
jgi:hypothetical protein